MVAAQDGRDLLGRMPVRRDGQHRSALAQPARVEIAVIPGQVQSVELAERLRQPRAGALLKRSVRKGPRITCLEPTIAAAATAAQGTTFGPSSTAGGELT